VRRFCVAFNESAGGIVASHHDFALERYRDIGHAALQLGAGEARALELQEREVDALAASLAALDRFLEGLENVVAQERTQHVAFTARKRGDDHLVSSTGTGQETIGVEGAVNELDVHQRARERSAAGA